MKLYASRLLKVRLIVLTLALEGKQSFSTVASKENSHSNLANRTQPFSDQSFYSFLLYELLPTLVCFDGMEVIK